MVLFKLFYTSSVVNRRHNKRMIRMTINDRPPAVAGSFYSSSPIELQQNINDMLAVPISANYCPKALIVPHAGYYYSGAIAANAYAYLSKQKHNIRKVVLIGPSHHVYLQGCAVPSFQTFSTPLGTTSIDRKSCEHLVDLNLASQIDEAHALEHSLEVQLPFLQTCLTDFELVPIVIGQATAKEVSRILAEFSQQVDTLIIASSDLSHYHSCAKAQIIDNKTIHSILNFDTNIQPEDACGCYAVSGLLDYAKQQHWQIELISHGNSGDISGDKNSVVGYASFTLY